MSKALEEVGLAGWDLSLKMALKRNRGSSSETRGIN